MSRRPIVLALVLFTLAPAVAPSGAALPLFQGELLVDFVWSPDPPYGSDVVTFTSTATSTDGIVLLHEWTFETASGPVHLRGSTVDFVFGRSGVHLVTHSVTDSALRVENVTKRVVVANAAPRANFSFFPSPAYRGSPVQFHDTSSDPDGDALVQWTWDLGDGVGALGRNATHTYADLGTYPVTLAVQDEAGQQGFAFAAVRVVNRAPVVAGHFSPDHPVANETVEFVASGIDPDVPGGAVTYEWRFSDGVVLEGERVTRAFSKGNHTAVLRGRDADGGVSQPVILVVPVGGRAPAASFTFSPAVPTRGEPVQFTDTTTGSPAAWRWSFGDGPGSSHQQHPIHAFASNGTFRVRLEVTSSDGLVNLTSRDVQVNAPPSAAFLAPSALHVSQPFTLQDLSHDADGALVNWTWSFGDGTLAFGPSPPAHSYSAPGTYLVELIVQDDHGATARATRVIDVRNAPPVARWTFSTSAQERGVPFHFDGTLSHDPEGMPIQDWTWRFGDGSPAVSGATPTHTFARSGFHLVGLVVDDGLRTSLRTDDSHVRLRVGASHDVVAQLTAARPDGTLIDLSDPQYTVSATLFGAMALGPEHLQPNGLGIDVRVPQDLWLHGMPLDLQVSSPAATGVAAARVTLLDDVHAPSVRVVVPVLPVTQLAVGPSVAGRIAPDGSPIYTDPTEAPHGEGTLRWSDGAPIAFESVRIEARYVGLLVAQPLRESPPADRLAGDSALVGWCPAGLSTSDASGAFAWELDGDSPCVTHGLLDGAYAPGRWEVRAVLLSAMERPSAPRAFIEDPTDGILTGATLGMM